jgi:hypothetical protein
MYKHGTDRSRPCGVLGAQLGETLADGELVIDVDGERRVPRFLVYDVIACRGQPLAQETSTPATPATPRMYDYLNRLRLATVRPQPPTPSIDADSPTHPPGDTHSRAYIHTYIRTHMYIHP